VRLKAAAPVAPVAAVPETLEVVAADVSRPVDTSGGRPRLTDQRWQALLDFCLINDEDLAILRDAADVTGRGAEVKESFYSHILQQPDLRAIIERNSTVERLGDTLVQYFHGLFSGTVDDRRVESVQRIGVVHDRIDLPISSYIGAILRIDRVVIPYLVDRHRADPVRLSQAILAYRKLTTMDVALVTQTFIDARDQTLELVDEIERQTQAVAMQQEQITEVSQTLAAGAEESYASSSELDDTAKQLAERAGKARDLTTEGVQIATRGAGEVERTEQAVTDMEGAVHAISEHVGALATQTEEITNIVKGVREIADQTNLLALHAASEAARAGEHGRGFAVVAEEVRKLADRTRQALEDITQLNRNSLTAITSVQDAVGATSQQVESVKGQAAAAREGFGAIDASVATTAEELIEIVSGIEAVSRSASEATAVAEQMARTSEQLGTLAEDLAATTEQAKETVARARRN
jgi:heme-based aerotactic transducer